MTQAVNPCSVEESRSHSVLVIASSLAHAVDKSVYTIFHCDVKFDKTMPNKILNHCNTIKITKIDHVKIDLFEIFNCGKDTWCPFIHLK